jgi:hypothetical protein
MNERIEARLQELRDMASEFASAYAARSYLEEMKKSKLAILMKEAEVQGHKTTAAQEREARAHPEYLSLLEGLKVATENSEKLRWQLEVAKLGVGVWQTTESTRRMEMQVYGKS